MNNENKSIEIPFGAKDSELDGWEYTIPEGFEAVIENGKVKVRKTDSEDEKIRKALISQYQGDGCLCNFGTRISYKGIVAWLEKQGEQKPMIIPKFKVGDTIRHIDFGYTKVYTINGILDDCYLLADDIILRFEYEYKWELVEQQPAWSEEDEEMLGDIIKDLVHPWNEYIPDRIEEEIKWLKNRVKSLRPQKLSNVERIGKNWKPSDEQIRVVARLRHCLLEDVRGDDIMILDNLLEQLKAL